MHRFVKSREQILVLSGRLKDNNNHNIKTRQMLRLFLFLHTFCVTTERKCIFLTELHQENCLSFLPKIPNKSIDLILIDPPYLISRNSGFAHSGPNASKQCATKFAGYKTDFGNWDKEELNLEFLLNQFYRILKNNGTLIMFYDFWKMQEVKETAEAIGFKQPRLGGWNKTNPVPINSKLNYLSNGKEFFCSFVKKSKPTFNSEYDTGEYYIEEQKEYDTYFYPICHGKERTVHPTQKPLELIKQLVLKHSNERDFVLDCFAGSGTTGQACEETNRNCILCEINADYCEIIGKRTNAIFCSENHS